MKQRRRRLRAQKGASSIEFVLYTPLLFFVIFVIVQFALTWHSNQIASAVAREVARVARIEGGDAAARAEAEQYGYQYAQQIGPSGIYEVDIDVVPVGTDQVRATVTGRAKEIIIGLSPTVRQTVQGPIEEFRPDL